MHCNNTYRDRSKQNNSQQFWEFGGERIWFFLGGLEGVLHHPLSVKQKKGEIKGGFDATTSKLFQGGFLELNQME